MSANRQFHHTKELLKLSQKRLSYCDNVRLHHLIEQFINGRIQGIVASKNHLANQYAPLQDRETVK